MYDQIYIYVPSANQIIRIAGRKAFEGGKRSLDRGNLETAKSGGFGLGTGKPEYVRRIYSLWCR